MNDAEATENEHASPKQDLARGRRSWLSDAILIGAFTVLAYALAFLHEGAFAEFFGMPLDFITIHPSSFLFAAMIGLIAFGMFYIIGTLSYWAWASRKEPLHRRVLATVMFACLAFVGWLGMPRLLCYIMLLVVVGLVLYVWLWALFRERKTRGYLNKLRAQDRRPSIDKFGELMAKRVGPRLLLALLMLLSTPALAISLGRTRAKTQREFLIPSDDPGMVVLRIYGDKLICAPLNRETKTVKKSFVILKLTDGSNRELRKEKVGPLRPAS